MLVRDRGHGRHGIQHAGGRFRVHDGDEVGLVLVQRVPDRVRIARTAPLDVETPDDGAVTAADLGETLSEIPGDHRQHARAGLHQIRDGDFHRRRAGAGHRKRERVRRRLKDTLHTFARVAHQLEELRIEMTEHRRREGAHDARRDQTRTRAEQQSLSGWQHESLGSLRAWSAADEGPPRPQAAQASAAAGERRLPTRADRELLSGRERRRQDRSIAPPA